MSWVKAHLPVSDRFRSFHRQPSRWSCTSAEVTPEHRWSSKSGSLGLAGRFPRRVLRRTSLSV